MNEVIEQACARVGPLAQSKGIRIERALSQDIVYFSGAPLLQELSILFLDTAIKYPPRDTLVQANVEKAEGQLHIKLRDQGHGIPIEHAPHIVGRCTMFQVPLDSTLGNSAKTARSPFKILNPPNLKGNQPPRTASVKRCELWAEEST